MFGFHFSLRAVTTWLLVGALSGIVPATAVEQPGIPATASIPAAVPTSTALSSSRPSVARIAALPQDAAQPQSAAVTGASAPAKHHMARWVWVAIAAGAAVGVGAGVVAANGQSGKTAATTPSTTINAGSGVTAGAPH